MPSWGFWAETGVFLLVAAYLIVLLPRLSAGMAAVVTLLLLAVLVGAHFGLMTTQLMWLQLMVPATLLLVGHLLLTIKRFVVTERGKEKSDLDSAESNRMLGLAFQGQGQLDMAFDKFRKCPLDDAADGEPLQPGAGFRAQAPVQQGRVGVPLHGRLQSRSSTTWSSA